MMERLILERLIPMNERGVIVLTRHAARTVSIWILAIALTLGLAPEARAQSPIRTLIGQFFISPLAGYDFGGDATCPNIPDCTNKYLNYGLAVGTMGKIVGLEEELAYAKHFYGSSPGLDSSALTLMSNFMVIPAIGPIRPYGLGGVGLIKSHSDWNTTDAIYASNNHDFGWDAGGGIMLLVGGHLGLRADIRYFHSFQNLSVAGFTPSNSKLDFARAGGGLVFKF
jgi:opacity protein-like surface antigen